ncbi:membrane protein [Deinococcus aetherius]|uniref:Membrane protein n=1 Tax=Deinococcus aetherius TaxID=200252 RepID=A0ABM8AAR4_9DEIO|nr:LysE family transporter [Deinococcus aetherius]BDP40681.1 membrane protein [Deinococcus aetherius]
MPLTTDWLAVLTVGALAVMSPGANLAVTLRNTLGGSRAAGVATAAGLALGDAVYVGLCLVGLVALLEASPALFRGVQVAGALYLVYLGVQFLRARPYPSLETGATAGRAVSPVLAARMGLLTCLLNPKVGLFFLALFTQVIRPETPLVWKGVFGLTVVLTEFAWFAVVALTLSRPVFQTRYLRFAHLIERATGAVLLGLALKLVWT